MIQRKILCNHDYLHVPIIPGGERNEMQIWAGGELVLSPCLALTDEGGAYFFVNVSQHKGKELTILLPDPKGITQKCLDRIVSGEAATKENPLYPNLYREPLRPAYHFSSKRGWLNDPNGLVYKDGVFHMFYQHNPLGTPHGSVNICWGHAVSADLLHWEEKDDAIRPWRRDWSIASGSAVVDYEDRAGYGKDAIIAAFTVLGTQNTDRTKPGYPSGGQFLAASMDGVGEDLGYEGMPFSQCMSIPAEIYLKRFEDGLRVCRRPVDQTRSLFGAVASESDFALQGEAALPMHNPAHYSVSLSAIQGTVSIRAGEHRIRFDSATRILSFENGHTALFQGEELHFEVLADTTTIEFCFEDSIMATYAMAPEHMSLIVKGECQVRFTCHATENVWE